MFPVASVVTNFAQFCSTNRHRYYGKSREICIGYDVTGDAEDPAESGPVGIVTGYVDLNEVWEADDDVEEITEGEVEDENGRTCLEDAEFVPISTTIK